MVASIEVVNRPTEREQDHDPLVKRDVGDVNGTGDAHLCLQANERDGKCERGNDKALGSAKLIWPDIEARKSVVTDRQWVWVTAYYRDQESFTEICIKGNFCRSELLLCRASVRLLRSLLGMNVVRPSERVHFRTHSGQPQCNGEPGSGAMALALLDAVLVDGSSIPKRPSHEFIILDCAAKLTWEDIEGLQAYLTPLQWVAVVGYFRDKKSIAEIKAEGQLARNGYVIGRASVRLLRAFLGMRLHKPPPDLPVRRSQPARIPADRPKDLSNLGVLALALLEARQKSKSCGDGR